MISHHIFSSSPNNPVYIGELYHCYMLGKSIFSFSGFRVYFVAYFYSIFDGKFCQQKMQTLIRGHILWHLIWVCTICLLPFYGFLRKNVLTVGPLSLGSSGSIQAGGGNLSNYKCSSLADKQHHHPMVLIWQKQCWKESIRFSQYF